MPTYAYRCPKCEHTFEEFHGIKDTKPRKCPECGARAVRVPSGGAGLLFKGSGFYITDYRSKSYQETARKESGTSDKSGKGASDKKASDPGAGKGGDKGGSGKSGKSGKGD